MARVLIIDGFIDEPACLGVPPYLSPQVRAVAGAAKDAGAEATYLTIDAIRNGQPFPKADLSVVLAGAAVPGKYLRALPASGREIERLSSMLPGWRMLSGPAVLDARFRSLGLFDAVVSVDPAAATADVLAGKAPSDRWRSMSEWNRWLLQGADIVLQHPDFPQPLIAEVETFRGCVRYRSGGCSFCVEPMKGEPAFREPRDIIAECRTLHQLGVRNFRLGAQTCIISYKADLSTGDPPRPDPSAIEELFAGVAAIGPEVLHVDNANPAVIAAYPEESRAVLRSLVRHCTSGNVLALGMESADPAVQKANNLNASSEAVMTAVRMINEEGREVGDSGLPHLLPGINFIIGLDGESARTLELDMSFLKEVVAEGHLLRRVNIRQVIPIRREFHPTLSQGQFIKFKEQVRKEIDRPLLQKLAPHGTLLRRVFTEIREGSTTFGRQIGTYPLLVGIPYPVELNRFIDVKVTGWGFRSLTAIEYPLDINRCSLAALEALPSIGRKRAVRLFHKRPIGNNEELKKALDDPKIAQEIADFIVLK
jgi:radical SAM superfamily enzyme with C-terminal helix-hairpin-helix motif